MVSLHTDSTISALVHAQVLKDSTISLNSVYSGFSFPTGVAFLNDSSNSIHVIEKNGNVKLISDDVVQESPILKLNVDSQGERGLLGIDVLKKNDNTVVFFYFTEKLSESVDEDSENLRNRVYSFQWDGNNLINQTLLLDLPALPGTVHNGGKLTIGKDTNLYVIIGDKKHETKVQNIKNGDDPDFTGSIFRINPLNGSALLDNPFIGLDVPNMEKTYSYGIRNSFGLASDPITGTIWDTENGPSFSDEINIVYPGFNSGWLEVMGPISSSGGDDKYIVEFANSKYYDPLVTWPSPVAVTDIEFIDTLQLGLEYRNNILVGDHNNGNLYFFRVNEDRTGINLNDPILDSENEMESSILGSGFGSISDIETGSDGNMYIVSLGTGTVYTIS